MATIKVKGTKELAKRLNRDLNIKLNKLFRDKNLRSEIGVIVVADIKKNVEFGAPSSSTLKWRKTYDKLNKTDSAYDRNKIKAVFTGELLADLGKNVLGNTTDKTFVIGNSDKLHKKYRGKSGLIGKKVSFSKIAEYLVNDLKYDFLKLSDEGRDKILSLVRDRIFKLLS